MKCIHGRVIRPYHYYDNDHGYVLVFRCDKGCDMNIVEEDV